MIKKLLLLTGVLVLGVAAPAAAGGWAATTLDAPPVSLTAGQDHAIGFTILQHGMTPVNPDSGVVGLRLQPASGPALTFPAVQQGDVGHFVATVRVPDTGTYTWEALQGWFEPQPLGTIEVVAAGATAAAGQAPANAALAASSGSSTEWWRIAAVVIGGLLALAVVIELVRDRRRGRKQPAPA